MLIAHGKEDAEGVDFGYPCRDRKGMFDEVLYGFGKVMGVFEGHVLEAAAVDGCLALAVRIGGCALG